MHTRPFGSTGNEVPVIGQGTWNMERDDPAACRRALRRGIEAGASHIDTAEAYGDGVVEELVGQAIAGLRDRVFLATKVKPTNASRSGTVAACEASLRRLDTERIDLYLLHWPGEHPLADTIAAFDELQAAGKIGSYGVSNFGAEELEQAIELAGPGRIACNQVLYHLGQRAVEHRILDVCQQQRVALVGYSPFNTGDFPHSKVLDEIAAERGMTAHQISLAYLVRREPLFAIPKAADPDHAAENAAAGDLVLSAPEIRRLEEAFPRGPYSSDAPTG
jgi:diketogulonate reductase-like aldo/keto reductase